jgi:hypothetical protein
MGPGANPSRPHFYWSGDRTAATGGTQAVAVDGRFRYLDLVPEASSVEQAATALRAATKAEREAVEAVERAVDAHFDDKQHGSPDWEHLSRQLRASQMDVHATMEFWEAIAEAGSYGK